MQLDSHGYLDDGSLVVADPDALQITEMPSPSVQPSLNAGPPADGFGFLPDGGQVYEPVPPVEMPRPPADGWGFLGDGTFVIDHMTPDEPVRHDSSNPDCFGSCAMGWGCEAPASAGGPCVGGRCVLWRVC